MVWCVFYVLWLFYGIWYTIQAAEVQRKDTNGLSPSQVRPCQVTNHWGYGCFRNICPSKTVRNLSKNFKQNHDSQSLNFNLLLQLRWVWKANVQSLVILQGFSWRHFLCKAEILSAKGSVPNLEFMSQVEEIQCKSNKVWEGTHAWTVVDGISLIGPPCFRCRRRGFEPPRKWDYNIKRSQSSKKLQCCGQKGFLGTICHDLKMTTC